MREGRLILKPRRTERNRGWLSLPAGLVWSNSKKTPGWGRSLTAINLSPIANLTPHILFCEGRHRVVVYSTDTVT